MALSYPLTMPSVPQFRAVRFRAKSAVGIAVSPFTYNSQVTAHQGEMWEVDVELPPMQRAAAETWIAFLVGLNGFEGSFLLGDPLGETPQGTWSGTQAVNGGGQSGKTLEVRGLDPFATVTAGDWLQLGSGSGAKLHKLIQDATSDSNGEATLEIWPRLRSSPIDGATITVQSAQGLFRLAGNVRTWDLELAALYGISFSAIEYL